MTETADERWSADPENDCCFFVDGKRFHLDTREDGDGGALEGTVRDAILRDHEQASTDSTCQHIPERRYQLHHDREDWPANEDWWCRDCGTLTEHGRVVEPARQGADFFKGIEAVTAIRCLKHVAVPKANENASGGAECGACAAEATDRTDKALSGLAREYGPLLRESLEDGRMGRVINDFLHDLDAITRDAPKEVQE